MATTATIFLALLSTLALLAAAEDNNVLFTGDVLQTGSSLEIPGAEFIIQGDCNLVLYGGGFQSNTATHGHKCTLTLNDIGQLVIIGDSGQTVWKTSRSGGNGRYAAVLRPDNVVAIYGPKVWGTTSSNLVSPPSAAHAMRSVSTSMNNILFSGEYVLVLETSGQAAIYGPIIWTTKDGANIKLSSVV